MKKTNILNKNSDLILILSTNLGANFNLARVKFISMFIIALCKRQTVNFSKLSKAFDTLADADSSLRRIQRFISNFSLDSNLIARLVFGLLPEKRNLILTIDRTNWKVGKLDINIFMLGIVYQGVAFPLLFSMLAKRGNSNTQERIDLINRYINLFGKNTINCIVADREFVGKYWIDFLNRNQLRYYIRIKQNFKVFIPHKNKEVKAFWLFNAYKVNEFVFYNKIVRINGQFCYLSGCKLKGNDYLILVSFNKPQDAKTYYKERWQIEMTFKAMKSSGFDIEKTHLQDLERIEKLILLVMIAFVWCYKTGIYLHQNYKAICIKKHGRKAISIFKYGLDYISNYLLNSKMKKEINIYHFLSCT
jgi:transposase